MTGQWCSHAWAWEGIGPPTWEPGQPTGELAQPIRMFFSSQKERITDAHTPQIHQLSGWLVSDDTAGEEGGCRGPGLAWLHVVCGCEVGWTYCGIVLCDKTAHFKVAIYCSKHKVHLRNDRAV